jgi:uracil-DNA glycosylase
VVHPKLVVCLGATAAPGLLGSDFRVTRQRGTVLERDNLPPLMATVHPSSILRAPTEEDRHREMNGFIADLKKAREFLKTGKE